MEALEYEEVLKELECPVCTNHMMAPIYLCLKGHSICNDCYFTLKECPTCRSLKSESRNYTLENMVEKLKIPCKYTERGCTFKARGCDIGKHTDYCDFGDMQCLLCEDSSGWEGQRQQLLNHFKTNHNDNFKDAIELMEADINFAEPNVDNNRFYVYMIDAFNKPFLFFWKMAKLIGCIPWCVYYLGAAKEACQYAYEINIKHPKSNNDSITIKSTCQSLQNTHSVDDLENNALVMLKYKQLTSYCDDEGDLSYQVKIIKYDDKKKEETLEETSEEET